MNLDKGILSTLAYSNVTLGQYHGVVYMEPVGSTILMFWEADSRDTSLQLDSKLSLVEEYSHFDSELVGLDSDRDLDGDYD